MVRFFSGMSSHVYDEHVLSFERFFISRTIFPTTNKSLLATSDVLAVKMLKERKKIKIYYWRNLLNLIFISLSFLSLSTLSPLSPLSSLFPHLLLYYL